MRLMKDCVGAVDSGAEMVSQLRPSGPARGGLLAVRAIVDNTQVVVLGNPGDELVCTLRIRDDLDTEVLKLVR